MVASLVLTGKYNIEVGEERKIRIKHPGSVSDKAVTLDIDKDIPFIRYRFDKYEMEEIQYIQKMKELFNKQAHLVEINFDENTDNVLQLLDNNSLQNVIRYLYIDITDIEANNRTISQDKIAKINNYVVSKVHFDRLMLRDKTTNMYIDAANAIIHNINKALPQDARLDIGICGSPLSYTDGNCCLTSVKARELMSIYGASVDLSLPTANHQCMDHCGCIRYIVINDHIEKISDSSVKKTKSDEGKTKNSSDKPKVNKNKNTLPFDAFTL